MKQINYLHINCLNIIKQYASTFLKPQNIQGKGHIFTIANLHSNKRNSTTQETVIINLLQK
jgi:hypothetical protein